MTGKVNLYLTRHGKTMFNTLDRVQGWSDTPLTEAGVEVAEALGRGLKGSKFQAVYTSDLRRTIKTAEIILHESGQSDLAIQRLTDLREFGFGEFEGLPNMAAFEAVCSDRHFENVESMLETLGSGSFQAVAESIAKLDQSGMAENWETMLSRIKRAMKTMVAREQCESDVDILVVTHGMTINSLLTMIAPDKVDRDLENASITKVIATGEQLVVESVNDLSYVRAGRRSISQI